MKISIAPKNRHGQERLTCPDLEAASQGVTPCDKAWPGKETRDGTHAALPACDSRVTTCHKKRSLVDLIYYGFHNLETMVTHVVT
jgi:hypothetical protein